MKKQIFTLAFALCAAFGYSQTPNSATWPASGNVGMGTATPTVKLDVIKPVSSTVPISAIGRLAYFGTRVSSSGVNGTGLYIEHKATTQDMFINGSTLSISSVNGTNNLAFIGFNATATTNTAVAALTFGTASSELMRINQDGKVRIGSNDRATPAGYKLFVEEGILTEKVKVAVSTTADWADYVFASDYKLMPLEEVEKFTKENNHLPNIPSAADMVTQGLDVAKMDAKLLEKIEELTLYAVQQNKENKDLKAELESQKREIEELKGMLKDLLTKK